MWQEKVYKVSMFVNVSVAVLESTAVRMGGNNNRYDPFRG